MNTSVTHKLDLAFSPDIAVKVSGDNSIITATNPITTKGADYLLRHAILEKSYDEIDMENLMWEVTE